MSRAALQIEMPPAKVAGSLRIGEPGDAFEREADRVAEDVIAGRGPQWSPAQSGARLQRKCDCGGECDECKEKEKLRRKAASAEAPSHAPGIVHDVLRAPGRPLDRPTQQFFESRFQYDFGRVRVHTGAQAALSAAAVNAAAYTVGDNIVFAAGRYDPTSRAGQSLMAHELAHVVQQSGEIRRKEQAPEEATDPEIAAVLRAAARAQQAPNDQTRLMLSGSEIAYRLIKAYLPEYNDLVSSVGYSAGVKGVRATKSGNNVDLTVGKDFVLSTGGPASAGMDQGSVMNQVLSLRTALQGAGVTPKPAVHGQRGLIGEQIRESPAPDPEQVKQYQAALDNHKQQAKQVSDLLTAFAEVPRSKEKPGTSDETRLHAGPNTLLQNTLQWLVPPPGGGSPQVNLNILTPTHDSPNRVPGQATFFDSRTAYPDVEGKYNFSPTQEPGDPGVVARDAGGDLLGEAHGIRVGGPLARARGTDASGKHVDEALSSIFLFLEPGQKITLEGISKTLEHEVQHIADRLPQVAVLDAAGVTTSYETEFRAYWIESPVEEQECIYLGNPEPSCHPKARETSGLNLNIGSGGSGSPGFGSPTKKPSKDPIEPVNANACSPSPCKPGAAVQPVQRDFDNERQKNIFLHLARQYRKQRFDCFYLCDQTFQDFVHRLGGPGDKGKATSGAAGVNAINSIRIEALLNAAGQCNKKMAPSDDAPQRVEGAAKALDQFDQAFLKDRAQSAPAWKELEDKVPDQTLASVRKLIS